MYKIIGADQKEYGPISSEQIRLWITEGRVNAQTQVLAEGTAEWKPLSAFPEFASALGFTPAAPPLAGMPGAITGAPPAKAPGSIKVFGILNIIFGSFAILCSPFSFIGIPVAAKQAGYSPLMVQWMFVSAIIGLIGGVILLISGIGLLKRLSWARKLAVYYAMFACVMAVINAAVVVVNMSATASSMPAPQRIGMIAGTVFGVFVGLTYNALVIVFLSKREVKLAVGEAA